jgi:glycosyltransferase involved in cell wall biosynthesis
MSAQLRIGFDGRWLGQRAGIGRYSRELLRALLEHEPNHQYVLLSHGWTRASVSRVKDDPVAGESPVPASEPPLRASDLDVCHFTNYHVPVALSRPLVVTVHDLSLISTPEMHPRVRVVFGRPRLRAAARRAAAILTPTEAVRGEAIRALDLEPSKVHVVPEAPAAQFQRVRDDAQLTSASDRYGVQPGFLMTIGTLEPRKNHARLVDAFARLRADGFEQPLLICGARGWKTGGLRARIRRLRLDGSVRLLGFVPESDLPRLLSLAGAFAYPSLYEGFGLPVVEALACGTPTVTSNRGALAEVAGEAAIQVDPTDVGDLARGLGLALGDHEVRDKLRVAGPRMAARYRWDEAAHRTAAVYERVAGSLG